MRQTGDTIFALSSGSLPAGIAVVRISGPEAGNSLQAFAGSLPSPRRAGLRSIVDPHSGELLDRALVLWMPGPSTATGEDLAELHLHGGRSVVAGVLGALARCEGLRPAEAGEFTRRGFENGRMDLSEAEGLADLLNAETAGQRSAALRMAGGGLRRLVEGWQQRLLGLAADVEAELDFSDEGDVQAELGLGDLLERVMALAGEIDAVHARPPAERLKDGIRVVLAGPPNVGKSRLINALVSRDVAIVSDIPGTTRDVIEAPVSLGGTAFVFTDTAGLRESNDRVEAIGVERARLGLEAADIVLWLGDAEDAPAGDHVMLIRSKADLDAAGSGDHQLAVSAVTGKGLGELVDKLLERSRSLLPPPNEIAINQRQRDLLMLCGHQLQASARSSDLLIVAEHLRLARIELDRITGRAGVEDMLDALFGNFCVGK